VFENTVPSPGVIVAGAVLSNAVAPAGVIAAGPVFENAVASPGVIGSAIGYRVPVLSVLWSVLAITGNVANWLFDATSPSMDRITHRSTVLISVLLWSYC